MYPDGANQTDETTHIDTPSNVKVSRRLSWYNPFSWVSEAYSTNCDILHAQWWSLPLWPIYFVILCIANLRKKPVIITVHNVIPHETSIIYKILVSFLLKKANHFIVHTKINKIQLSSYFKIHEKDISVIPHGPIGAYIDSDTCFSAGKKALKNKLGLRDSCKVILIFGAIRKYKGIDTALYALEKICAKGINCHLIIAGKAWVPWEPYDKLVKQLKLEKNVTCFTDYIPADQVKIFFASADLVILPYKHFDAQSGVASVAGAFGKPMIVSDTGGLSDWVADKKWALPPDNVDALANAMTECLEDQNILNKMTIDSEKMAKLHSWDSIAKKTSELYQKIFNDVL
ncbi:glycosyltransferase family 4 protein [Desulforegula conservatrix]|uniref:glycosyltransferase family 4 protein n=1 Tax=Desulforegula conservatrix TaxID=153026 RepID=UPI000416EDBB|nr:glycosyltransferase family 4 protein [Desulforegula conservatrix]